MYLDSKVSVTIKGHQWNKFAIPGNFAVAGTLPKVIETAWEYSAANTRRSRYIYTLQSFSPVLWQCQAWGNTGKRIFWNNFATESTNTWKLQDISQSWSTVLEMLAWFSPALSAGPLPANIGMKVIREWYYTVQRQDQQWTLAWWDIGGLQTMPSYTEHQEISFAIPVTDIPAPDPVFVVAECGATPGHVHPEDTARVVTTTLTWQNRTVLDHPSSAYSLELIDAVGRQIWSFAGVLQPGTGKTTVTVEKMMGVLAGGVPAANSSFNIEAKLYRGSTLTDHITLGFTVGGPPAANPHIVPEMTTVSIPSTQKVAPDEDIGFRVILRKHADEDSYETGPAYLAVLCHGNIRILWTGKFAAGSASGTAQTIDVALTPNEMYGGSITTSQYLEAVLYCGNGDAFSLDTATGSLSFTFAVVPPVAPAQSGTIKVSSDPPGAAFSLAGAAGYTGTTPWQKVGAPTGQYCITWGNKAGYTAPPSGCQNLANSGTIQFTGNYDPEGTPGAEEGTPWPVVALGIGAAAAIGWAAYKRRGK